MRGIGVAIVALTLFAAGAAEAAPIPCSDIPAAQRFLAKLKPGPNTRAAERHLAAARRAKSAAGCDRELRQVDFYARRSLAADKKRAAKRRAAPPPRARAEKPCADLLHQDRPGGSDYRGPREARCR